MNRNAPKKSGNHDTDPFESPVVFPYSQISSDALSFYDPRLLGSTKLYRDEHQNPHFIIFFPMELIEGFGASHKSVREGIVHLQQAFPNFMDRGLYAEMRKVAGKDEKHSVELLNGLSRIWEGADEHIHNIVGTNIHLKFVEATEETLHIRDLSPFQNHVICQLKDPPCPLIAEMESIARTEYELLRQDYLLQGRDSSEAEVQMNIALSRYEDVMEDLRSGCSISTCAKWNELGENTIRRWLRGGIPNEIIQRGAEMRQAKRRSDVTLSRAPSESLTYVLAVYAACSECGTFPQKISMGNKSKQHVEELARHCCKLGLDVSVREEKRDTLTYYSVIIDDTSAVVSINGVTAGNSKVPFEWIPEAHFGFYLATLTSWRGSFREGKAGGHFKIEKAGETPGASQQLLKDFALMMGRFDCFARLKLGNERSELKLFSTRDLENFMNRVGIGDPVRSERLARVLASKETDIEHSVESVDHVLYLRNEVGLSYPEIFKETGVSRGPAAKWSQGKSLPRRYSRREEVRTIEDQYPDLRVVQLLYELGVEREKCWELARQAPYS
ncbi:MAG: hypothetical protein KDD60_09015, partial [Bdellovibrionales bacterium]|nr:hypothetical protein [Bdellovibrionales bacterium]